MDFRETGLGVWIGFDWLRTGIGGGLLWVRWWTFGFLRHGVSGAVAGVTDSTNIFARVICLHLFRCLLLGWKY
jgi:hypothetical protein